MKLLFSNFLKNKFGKKMTQKSFHIPSLTIDKMKEVDRLMEEKYHIKLIQMMENAGRNLVDLGLPEIGLLEIDAREYVGESYLADIDVTPEIFAHAFGIHVPSLFFKNTLMRVQLPDTL